MLAFTDADCVPEPGWLKHGLAALAGRRPRPGPGAPPECSARPVRPHGLRHRPARPVRDREPPGPGRLFDRLGGFEPGWSPRGGQGARRGHVARLARAPGRRAGSRSRPTRGRARRVLARRAPPTSPSVAGSARSRRSWPGIPSCAARCARRRPFLTRRSAAFDAAALGVLTAAVTRRTAPLCPRAAVPRRAAEAGRSRGRRDGAAALVGGSLRARSLLL